MIVLLALLALAAPAHAAPPPKHVAGVKVLRWPSATTAAPGAQLTVKVSSKRRRTQLAFIQLAPRRALARRTLRRGTFTVTVPAAAGVRYEVRATIAGRRYASQISTPPAPVPALAPVPAPASAPPATPPVDVPATPCSDALTGTPELAIARTGDGLELTFSNRGPGCLGIPLTLGLSWDRDGEPIPIDCADHVLPPGGKPPQCAGLPAMIVLAPGESTTRRARVPDGLEPGRYRVTAELWRAAPAAFVEI